MKRNLILTGMFSTLFFCVSTVLQSHGQTLADLVAKNEKAIFQIFSYDEYGSPSSTGTGFFINQDGTGLTNLHVLEDARFAFVRDNSGQIYQIDKITRICEECDMAEFILSATGKNFPALISTDKIPLKGSDIFVIGNPKGFESTVSKGIVSAIREDENKIIQISAPISPGSSGSPIMDMNGNVFAIATYQHKEGQNLNFGYGMGCMGKMKVNTEFKLENKSTGSLHIINKVCKTENNLILNSIETNEKNTVVNMTFTNVQLSYGDGAFIFSVIGDEKLSFYIEDKTTGKKFYIYDSTIGNSAKDHTSLKLGESKKFKLFFPPIGSINEINISEGMQGSDWSFQDLNLSDYRTFSFEDKNFFNDFYYQTGLSYLANQDFAEAYIVLSDFVSKNEENDYAHHLAGIVSYILGNKLDAFIHIKEALEINPTNDDYYFTLYFLNKAEGRQDEALKNISSAIQLNNDQPEYFFYRGELFLEKEYWKEAVSDYNRFIDSDREIPGSVFFKRGYSKLFLKDRTACEDLEKAYNLEEDKENRKLIAEWLKKFCK
jgi:serine protease Do